MTVVFGGWGIVSCPPSASDPGAVVEGCVPTGTDACSSSHTIRAKHGLMNDLVWKWADGSFVAFDVADHRAFFDWGYNLSTGNIRWINKSGQGRCLTPVGTCSIQYGFWPLEACDRTGNDTCLFRRESDAAVSFTYGVAFNRHLISCLGTRINWDGSHVRNTWGSSCSSGGLTTTMTKAEIAKATEEFKEGLTLGSGDAQFYINRYLSKRQLKAFDRACLSKQATKSKCRKVALRIFRSLPPEVRERAREATP